MIFVFENEVLAKLSSFQQIKLDNIEQILAVKGVTFIVLNKNEINMFEVEMSKINDVEMRKTFELIHSKMEIADPEKYLMTAANKENFIELNMKSIIIEDDYSMQWIKVSREEKVHDYNIFVQFIRHLYKF